MEGVLFSRDQRIKLVNAHSPDEFMADFVPVDGGFPLDVLGLLRDGLHKETGAVVVPQELVLHFDEGLARRRRVHGVVLVLHLDIDGMHGAAARNGYAVRVFIDNVPAALLAVFRDMAFPDITENMLVEIPDVVVVGLVALAEYLVADNLLRLVACPSVF